MTRTHMSPSILAMKLSRLAARIDQFDPLSASKIDAVLTRLAYYDDDDEDEDSEIRDSDEYWLDNGNAMYANGDIGDINHEGYALMHMMGLLGAAEALNMSEDDMSRENAIIIFNDWCDRASGMEETPLHSYPEEFKQYVRKMHKKHGDLWADNNDLDEYLKTFYLQNNLGANPTPSDRARVNKSYKAIIEGFSDPRQYVKEHHGWQAVRGKNIEVHTLNEYVAGNLVNGLYEAFGNPTRHSFNIEVDYPVKTVLYGIPFEDLQNGSAVKRYLMEVARHRRVLHKDHYEAGKFKRQQNRKEKLIERQEQEQDAIKQQKFLAPAPKQTRRKDNPLQLTMQQELYAPPLGQVDPSLVPLFDPTQGAKNTRDQMHGIPGYVPQRYDSNLMNGPKRWDGTPVYREVGGATAICWRIARVKNG